MWSRTTRYLLFFALVAVLLGISNVDASYSREKRGLTSMATNTVEGMIGELESLPLAGTLMRALFNLLIALINSSAYWNNRIIGRLLGGAFPCTISLEEGIMCEGISMEHAVGKMIIDGVNQAPSILPYPLKWIINLFIALIIDPTLAVTFGGLPAYAPPTTT